MSLRAFRILFGMGMLVIPIFFLSELIDPFTQPKWVAFYFGIAMICLFGGVRRDLNFLIPRFSSGVLCSLGSLALLFIFHLIYFQPLPLLPYLFEVLALMAWIFLSFWLFQSEKHFQNGVVFPLLGATILCLGLALLQKFGFSFFSYWSEEYPTSFFGQQNITSEFLGYSLLFQIYLVFRIKKKSFLVGLLSVMFLSCFFLAEYQSRAVLLSLGLGSVVFLPSVVSSSWLRRLVRVGSIFVVLLGVWGAYYAWDTIQNEHHLESVKQGNTKLRLVRWMNTVHMIQDHPMGVGMNRYEFEYLPYHKAWKNDHEISPQVLARTPHNVPLELAAELGIPLALGVVTAYLMYLFFLFRKVFRGPIENGPIIGLFLSVMNYTGVNSLFAFPLDMAANSVIFGAVLGFSLRWFFPVRRVSSWVSQGIFLAMGVLFTWVGVLEGYSTYQEGLSQSFSLEKRERICELSPSRWRSCQQVAAYRVRKGEFSSARKVLDRMLELNPKNYFAIKLKAYILYRQNETQEACQLLKKSWWMTHVESQVKTLFQERCQNK